MYPQSGDRLRHATGQECSRLVAIFVTSLAVSLLAGCGNDQNQNSAAAVDAGAGAAASEPVAPVVSKQADTPVTAPALITLRSDDPSVRFSSVIRYGSPLMVEGLGTAAITWSQTPDEEGIECLTDGLVVSLSNGTTLTPRVNICDDWTATLTTAVSASRGNVLVDPELQWQLNQFESEDPTLGTLWRLVYAIPQTDAVAIAMECNAGAGFVTTTLYTETAGLDTAQSVPVQIDLDGRALRFDAAWTTPQSEEETATPLLNLGTWHPLWEALLAAGSIHVRAGNWEPMEVSVPADREATFGSFVRACRG